MSQSPLSPEAQLLVLTARGEPDGHGLSQRRLLDSELDWPKLAFLAQQEGATSILWQWLCRTGAKSLPSDVTTQWRKLAMVSEFQMLHLERALHDILALLAARGIETMLLKGSALAYTAYGSFTERPMSDLDLLVRTARAEEAWSLLQANGWSWPATRWPAAHYTAHQHLPPLVMSPGGESRVEIHGALLPGGHPFDWPVDAVWARAQRVRVRGRTLVVPHPLDQLLHVCVHFAWSHEMRWGAWRALRDVAVVTQPRNLAWKDFVELARDARAATCCYWTLRLARNLAGATVPDDVLRALRPPRPEFLLKRLERHHVLQLFTTESGCPSEALTSALWELGIAPRWSGHGSSRPWQVSEQWGGATAAESPELARARAGWVQRLANRARHAAIAIGYLGKLTAARFQHPA